MALSEKEVFSLKLLSVSAVVVALAIGGMYVKSQANLELAAAQAAKTGNFATTKGYPSSLLSAKANARQERYVLASVNACQNDDLYPTMSETAIVGNVPSAEPSWLFHTRSASYPELPTSTVNEVTKFSTVMDDPEGKDIMGVHQVLKYQDGQYSLVDNTRTSPMPLRLKCLTLDQRDASVARVEGLLAGSEMFIDIKGQEPLKLEHQENVTDAAKARDLRLFSHRFEKGYVPMAEFKAAAQYFRDIVGHKALGLEGVEYRAGEPVHLVASLVVEGTTREAALALLPYPDGSVLTLAVHNRAGVTAAPAVEPEEPPQVDPAVNDGISSEPVADEVTTEVVAIEEPYVPKALAAGAIADPEPEATADPLPADSAQKN